MGVRFLSVLETLLQMQLICEKWMLCYVFNNEVLFLVMMKHRIQRFMCIFELVCTKKDKSTWESNSSEILVFLPIKKERERDHDY